MSLLKSIILTCLFTASAALADVVKLVADPWCPYNCIPNSSFPGFIIEISREIYAKHNLKVEYVTAGWSRSIKMGKDGVVNGVIGANIFDAPNFVFPKEFFLTTENVLIAPADSEITEADVNDIINKKYTLGMVKDYAYTKKFNQYVARSPANVIPIFGEQTTQRLIRMLKRKRFQLALEDIHVWNYNVKKLGMKTSDFKKVGLILAGDMYIAFSPGLESSKKYAKILSDGLKEYKKTKRFKDVLGKYNVKHFKATKDDPTLPTIK